MITTTDLQGTVNFYVGNLGFNFSANEPNWSWACVQLDNVELMIRTPSDHTPFDKPIFTGSFYFKTINVDKLWNLLKDNIKICYEIEDFEYRMRKFAIYDNNGYLLQFGQEINGTANYQQNSD